MTVTSPFDRGVSPTGLKFAVFVKVLVKDLVEFEVLVDFVEPYDVLSILFENSGDKDVEESDSVELKVVEEVSMIVSRPVFESFIRSESLKSSNATPRLLS